MTEMPRACTPHDSSSLHMVGFLSVLAISGSLALISLMGKGKLFRQLGAAQDTWTTHSQGDLHSQEDFEEEEEEVHTHSHGDFEEEEEEEEIHTHSHIGYFEEQNLDTHSLLDSSCEENEHLLKSLHETHEPTIRGTLKRKKKVRFALDVVEPPCNGQHYRSKWRVLHTCHKPAHLDEPSLSHHQHYNSKRRVSQGHEMDAHFGVDEPPCNDRMYAVESTYNDQQYKSTCKVSQRDETRAHSSYHQMHSKLRKDSQGCEMQDHLLHPPKPSKLPSSIPANRLALYKGLRQSRLQYSLHHL